MTAYLSCRLSFTTRFLLIPVLLAAMLPGLPVSQVALAQAGPTLLVDPAGTDAGDCTESPCRSITYALTQAQSGDTIVLAAGTYSSSTETFPLTITDSSVTIRGPESAAAVIDAGGAGRIFTVSGSSQVTFENLTLINGNAGTGNGGAILAADPAVQIILKNVTLQENSAYHGGAVYSGAGNLSIENSTFLENTAAQDGGAVYFAGAGSLTITDSQIGASGGTNTARRGGGIFFDGGTLNLSGSRIAENLASTTGGGMYQKGGVVDIKKSTLHANRASSGAGLYLAGGTLTLNQSLLSANTASFSGGGLALAGSAAAAIHTSTLSGNNAGSEVGGGGAAWISESAELTLQSSTVAANSAAHSARPGLWVESGAVSSTNSLFVANSSDGFSVDGSNMSYDVLSDVLGPLADNGGPTLTHALKPGSTAFDGGICGDGDEFDQRGIARPSGAACDVGAFEFLHPAITLAADPLEYKEGDGVVQIDEEAVFTGDVINYSGWTLTVTLGSTWQENDVLAVTPQGDISLSSGVFVLYANGAPKVIATYSGGTSEEEPLELRLVPDATPQAIQALLRAITFETGANPDETPRMVTFTLQGQADSFHNQVSRDITVIDLNAAPLVTGFSRQLDEDTGLGFHIDDFMAHFSDADGDSLKKIKITALPVNGVLALRGTPVYLDQEILAGELGDLTYTPHDNYFGIDSFKWNGSDGDAYAGLSATVSLYIAPVNDLPAISGFSKTTLEDTDIAFNLDDFTAVFFDLADAGDTLQAIRITSLPDNGELRLAGVPVVVDQEIPAEDLDELVYRPDVDYFGSDVFSWNARDHNDYALQPAEVSITISPVNDAPVFIPGEAIVVNEDAGAKTYPNWATIKAGPDNEAGQVVTIDMSTDNDALFAELPAIDPISGDLTFTPADDAHGAATVTVILSDDGGTGEPGAVDTSEPQTFTITVNPVNDPPVFTLGDEPIVDEDSGPQSLAGWVTGISAGPEDESGHGLTFVTSNDNEDLFSVQPQIALDGTLTFTPAPDAYGQAIVTVTLKDDYGTPEDPSDDAETTKNFTIIINPVNDAPTLDDITDLTIDEDAAEQTVTLSGITAGPLEIQELSVTAVSSNTGLIPDPDVAYTSPDTSGILTFTPVKDAHGSAVITVTVSDGEDSIDKTFTVTVNSINDDPTLDDLTDVTINEDAVEQTVDLTGISAGGGETQDLTITASSDNTGLIPDPAVDYTSPDATGTLRFTPVADASGEAVITVEVSDGEDSIQKTFKVTVNPVNDAPSFTKGADIMVDEDAGPQSFEGWAAGISAGPADEAGQNLTFNISTDNDALFAVLPAIDPASGDLTFTPAPDANGAATVTVVLSDDGGTENGGLDTSAPQTFTITVNPVNDNPTIDQPDDMTINEDAGEQLVNLTGISAGGGESQELAVSAVSDNTGLIPHPAVSYTSPAATGALTFTPAADASGEALITVTVSDGEAETIKSFTVTVNAVNDAPSFDMGTDITVPEDSPAQSFDAWAANISAGPDDESGQTLTFELTTDAGHLFSVPPEIDPATGSLTFTPAPNAYGTAVITVVLRDDGGTAHGGVDATEPETFTIEITPVNDAPVITAPGTQTSAEDTPLVFSNGRRLSVTDDAGDNPISVTLSAVNGVITLSGTTGLSFSEGDGQDDGQMVFTGTLTAINAALNGLTFIPSADYSGPASLSIQVNDQGHTGGGPLGAQKTVSINVVAVNDAPFFSSLPPQTTTLEDQSLDLSGLVVGDVDAGSSPLEMTLSVDSGTLSLGGTDHLTFSEGDGLADSDMTFQGSLDDINAALEGLSFVPEPDFFGDVSFSFQVSDLGNTGSGGPKSASGALTLQVTSVNDAPGFQLSQSTVTVSESSGPQIFPGLAYDISAGPANEADQTLTFSLSTDNEELFIALPAMDESGELTFTPAPGKHGTAAVTITLSDDGGTENGGADSFEQTLTIVVEPVNDAPVHTLPADLNLSTLEDTPLVFAGDQKIVVNDDAEDLPVQVTLTAVNGSLSLSRVDGLTFSTGDGLDDLEMTFEGTLDAINAALDGLTFTPASDFNGSASLTILTDDLGHLGPAGGPSLTAQDTLVIAVEAVNDAPVFNLPADPTTLEDQELTLNGLTLQDVDAGGEELLVSLAVSDGTISLASTAGLTFSEGDGLADGEMTFQGALDAINAGLDGLLYHPDPDFFGSVTLSLQASDQGSTGSGGALTASETLILQVESVNDAPSFVKGANININEDAGPQIVNGWATGLSVGPANESDQTLEFIFTANSNPDLFAVPPAVSPQGDLTFTPAQDAFGIAILRLVVQDSGGTERGGQNRSPEQTFTISINSVNDAPLLTGEEPLLLDGILEDTPDDENPGTLISSLLASGGDRMTDADQGALEGVAVIAAPDSGWQYSLDGGNTWYDLGSPSETEARLLASDENTRLRFVPAPDLNGTFELVLRGWDRTYGVSGETADVTVNGGSTAFSAETLSARITVAPVNDAPIDIALTPATVAENEPAGTVVGQLSTTDIDSSSFTYSLLDGEDLDNDAFEIDGDLIKTNRAFDYETQDTYRIQVQTDDGDGGTLAQILTIMVEDRNDAPTAINLSSSQVAENLPAGTVIGSLSAVDQDAGDTHTFALVAGDGDADNAHIEIDGNELKTAAVFNFEDTPTLSIRLQALDSQGGSYEQVFTITVTDVNDAPTGFTISSSRVAENMPAGTLVGVLTALDEDQVDTHTFELVSGEGDTHNGRFAIQDDQLVTTAAFDYEAGPTSFQVRIRVTDAQGGMVEQTLIVELEDVNEPPKYLILSGEHKVAENLPAGTLVGELQSSDPDEDSVLTFSLVSGDGFKVEGNQLLTTRVFDFDTGDEYFDITLQVSDGENILQKDFTIMIVAVNEAPDSLTLDNLTLAENAGPRALVGTLSATDPDAGDTWTFSLPEDDETDNALFEIAGSELRAKDSLDYEERLDHSYRVRVTVTDSGGLTLTQDFTITLTDVSPEMLDIDLSLDEDSSLALDASVLNQSYLHNDSVPAAEVRIDTLPVHGALRLNGVDLLAGAVIPAEDLDGLVFVPQADYNGADSFTWNASDGTAYAAASGTVNLQINPVNDPPVIGDLSLETDEDQTYTFKESDITGIFSDVDGDEPAAIQIVTLPEHGRLHVIPADEPQNEFYVDTAGTELPAGAALVYEPDADYHGSDSFTWNLSDGLAYADTAAQVSITVHAVNDSPEVDEITLELFEDTTYTFSQDVFADHDAYRDVEDDPLAAVRITALPAHGVLSLGEDAVAVSDEIAPADLGSLKYTPEADFSGEDGFDWQVSDGSDWSEAARVVLDVQPVNDAPSFTAGADITVDEDAGPQTYEAWATGISAGPQNEDGQELTFSLSTDNDDLFAELPAVDTGGTLTFTPAPDAYGAANVTVTLSDDGGTANGGVDTSAEQTFTITVNPVNDDPTLDQPADMTIDEDAGEQIVTLSGITAGGGESQDLTVSASSDNKDLIPDPVVAYTSPQASGSLTFTPAANASGEATITVTVSDGEAEIQRSFTVTVNPVNDAPEISDISFETDEDQIYTFALSQFEAAFSDIDGDSLAAVTIDSLPVHGALRLNGVNLLAGAVILAEDLGGLVYVPQADFNGADSFTWNASDGQAVAEDTAQVSITVHPVNDAPSFTVGADITVDEADAGAAPQFFAGWATGISAGPPDEAGQTLTFLINTNNDGLFAELPAIDPATGDLTFKPTAKAYGSATITVALQDDGGTEKGGVDTSPAKTFTITVAEVNDPPTLDELPDVVIDEDAGEQTVILTGISAGPGENQTLTVTAVSSSTALIPHPQVSYTSPNSTGSLTFAPAANASGQATITVTVSDGEAETSRSFTVTVNPVNDAPVIGDISIETDENRSYTFALSKFEAAFSDIDGDSLAAVTIVTLPGHGVLRLNGVDVLAGTVIPAEDLAGLVYVPQAYYNGSDSFTWNASDGQAAAAQARQVNITVRPVNDPPTLDTLSDVTINEDAGEQTVTLRGITAGPGENQALTVTAKSSNTALIPHPQVSYKSPNSTGTLTFKPVPNASGKAVITVTVSDGAATFSRTFTVTVNPVNDPPVARDDSAVVIQGKTVTIAVLKNDSDIDGDRLRLAGVSQPAHGSVEISGDTIRYTAGRDFTGTDTFTYTVEDGNGGTASAKVTVTVKADVPKMFQIMLPVIIN